MKCFVILVITEAIGIVKKNLETIPGKHSIDSLQKNSLTRNIAHNKEGTAI
jgi:hypothetical protein